MAASRSLVALLAATWLGCQTPLTDAEPRPARADVVAPAPSPPTAVPVDGGAPSPALDARAPASFVAVEWHPVNHTVGGSKFFLAELTLTNGMTRPLTTGWKLAFHFTRALLPEGAGDATASQRLAEQGIRIADPNVVVGGDALAIEPLPDFVPLDPGERRVIRLLAQNWATHKTDAPAGVTITLPGESFARAVHASVRIDAADPEQTTRSPIDVLPVETPRLRYDANLAVPVRTLSVADQLVPRPLEVVESSGSFRLERGVTIGSEPSLDGEAAYLAAMLGDRLGDAPSRSGGPASITLAVDPTIPDLPSNAEGYALSVAPAGIRIVGADAAGVFHGIQTLRQLLPLAPRGAAVDVPGVVVRDAPLFRYRGFSLDVARHFQSKETIFRLLDLLAFYKLDVFHFHLTDDEGWRLAIPGLPELTTYGARRGFDPAEQGMLHASNGSASGLEADDGIVGKPLTDTEANGGTAPLYQGFEEASLNFVGRGSGFYTTQDFEEILSYAAARHIDVVPEIDLPTHARAAIKAMEYRYRTYVASDPAKASEYRLVDPFDTSVHVTSQGYRDNLVNPCLESTYAFMAKVVSEIALRYAAVPSARLVTIHTGGDELPRLGPNVWWQGSPACKSNPLTAKPDLTLYRQFFGRWADIVGATGARMAGWSDALASGVPKPAGFVAYPWNNVWGNGHEDEAYALANAGQPVVLAHATNLYLSQAANKDPDEPGSYWANYVDEKRTFEYLPFDVFANATADRFGNAYGPSAWSSKAHLADAARSRILGIEALIWSENVKSPALLDYFVFPKLLGVAERAWNRDMPSALTVSEAWIRFANTLGQAALPRLEVFRAVGAPPETAPGVNFRLPLPGGTLDGGLLHANVRLPGLAVEYSQDLGATWKVFHAPTPATAPVLLRTRSGERTSRVARVDR